MHELKKIFFKKKILIYGLSLTGISTFDYLRKTNFVSVYDDVVEKTKIKKYTKIEKDSLFFKKY